MDCNTIDFIVTDPPYGLNFMGKKWDSQVPNQEIWAEVFRICKPGAMLAAFGGSRTHHHLMVALEQAGWEIRDVIMWIYGSGFPKSHNYFGFDGYGTALKPAYEPIIIAMKPLEGTYAKNASKWGLGGINIDDSRIQSRWPANLIFDEESAKILDEQTGILKSGKPGTRRKDHKTNCMTGNLNLTGKKESGIGDSGGASRFFYCAKASAKEKNIGCEKNNHPTVKPISLMKYIIKLLAPPGNPLLLDPFSGSGSTLIAAKELGIRAIGIEMNSEYCEIAEKRIAASEDIPEQYIFNF